ncbi:hypothetical protein AJ80_05447 [Polytolypa hystricis UAMH7299]|uniref:Histone acetyltransferase type B catalytic subunit n=1 Tax=Polytolypa hystricis (strain UAMH7299) TaxID=1447883 RepID=A0A2B7Y3L7_POLH7|nr:hypothetical protein AJ80_05447 [Polytolypa hystricis UAMH7299]
MESSVDWSCDANEAIHISLVQPGSDGKLKTLSSFQPQFTYPIFGQEETIFGYKGLNVRLRFAAHNLKSNINIAYDEKFKPIEDTEALDLNKTLKPWLPEESFAPLPEFEQSVVKDETAKDFKPPGKLVHSYSRNQRNYEIWAASLVDPEARLLLNRIQIFVPFFIEGGTPIETDDFDWTLERWTIYFVYENLEQPSPSASPYAFVGYSNTYRWYYFSNVSGKEPEASDKKQRPTPSDAPFPYPNQISICQLPARLRISQFLILQPHQLAGHGSQLYRTIQTACLADPTISELTVEDPNEAFDALRDTNDYHLLYPEFTKRSITINPDPYPKNASRRQARLVPTSKLIPTEVLREMRTTFKIAPTQFAHLVEMYLLSQVPESHRGSRQNSARLLVQKWRAPNEHDRRYYWWRILLKQRLYKRHRDLLIQLDRDERLEKLDETVQNVEEGYETLLKSFDVRGKPKAEKEEEEEEAKPEPEPQAGESKAEEGEEKPRERTKRKFTIADDDEDEDEGPAANGKTGAAAGADEAAAKRLKT